MNGSRDTFSRNCARALLNYSACAYNPATVIALDVITYTLHTYKNRLASTPAKTYRNLLATLELGDCRLDLLINLLDNMGLLKLFPDCVSCFYELYKTHHGVATCSIRSSHILSHTQKTVFYNFLHRATEKKIIYTCATNKGLIAGVRIDSEIFLWEQSISRQLRAIAQLQ